MKLNRKFASVLLAGAMVAGIMAMPAGAASVAEGESVSFTKTLDMSDAVGASVPALTFSYTVVAGDGVSAGNNTPEILVPSEGNGVTGTPTIANVTFSSNSEIENSEVTVNATVNFDSVNFTKPGIYRYKITETDVTKNADVTNNSNTVRYLDVYVAYNEAGTALEIADSVLLSNAATPTLNSQDGKYHYDTTDATNKSDGYDASYTTYSLDLSKVVTGAMGDKGKDFTFTIEFNNVPDGMSFTQGDNTVTKNDDNKYLVSVSLKDGQPMTTITGIPSTVNYTITEDLNANEGYTTSYAISDKNFTSEDDEVTDSHASTKSGVSTGTVAMGKFDNKVVCTNTKEATTPTGLLMDVAPYAAMIVLAAAAAFVFLRRRSANED